MRAFFMAFAALTGGSILAACKSTSGPDEADFILLTRKKQEAEARAVQAESLLEQEREKTRDAEKRLQEALFRSPEMADASRLLDLANTRAFELCYGLESLVKLKDSPGAKVELEYAEGRVNELESQARHAKEVYDQVKDAPTLSADERKMGAIQMVVLETKIAEIEKLLAPQ